jgi:hypothetical protein
MIMPSYKAILVGVCLVIYIYANLVDILTFAVDVGSMKVSATEVARFCAQRAQLLASQTAGDSGDAEGAGGNNNEEGAGNVHVAI